MEANPFKHFISELDVKKEEPGVEFVKLPEHIEESFFRSEPESPISKAVESFRRFGLSEPTIKSYQQAVRAYFKTTSHASKENFPDFDKQKIHFRPQKHYYGPKLSLDSRSQIFPQALNELVAKPHLRKDGSSAMDVISVDGEEVLSVFKRAEARSDKLSPEEKFLVQLNRFIYALHEPIHTMQSSVPGDVVNKLVTEVDGWDLVDADRITAYLENNYKTLQGVNLHLSIPLPEGLEKSVIGLPEQLRDVQKPQEVKVIKQNPTLEEKARDLREQAFYERAHYLDAQFEASIDILAEDSIKAYLEKKPALLLWCHNTISLLVQALRAIRQKFENGEHGAVQDEQALEKISAVLETMSRAYFSVFRDSSEFLPYLEKARSRPALLNRFVTGQVIDADPFSRIDVENIMQDCRAYFTPESSPVRWNFPLSGKSHYATKDNKPFTDKGVEICVRLMIRAADAGWAFPRVKEIFDRVESALGRTTLQKDEIRGIQEDIADRLAFQLTEDELEEMRGVSDHLQVRLGKEYGKDVALRKELVHGLQKNHAEQVEPFFQGAFFTYPAPINAFALLCGFVMGEKPWNPKQSKPWDRLQSVTWDHIAKSQDLGLFKINVSTLSAQEQGKLKGFVERIGKEEIPADEYHEMLRSMAEWKRQGSNVSPKE